jgi:hypothetical protein
MPVETQMKNRNGTATTGDTVIDRCESARWR